MPTWKPFYGWMAFPRLDDGAGLTRSFTIGYRLTGAGEDEAWTQRFNSFKYDGFKYDKQTGFRGALNVMRAAFPCLVRGLKVDPSRTVLVPALASHEVEAAKRSKLSNLGQEMAKAAGVRFDRTLVRKQPHEPLSKGRRTAPERTKIPDAARYSADCVRYAENVLVLDDFITRGGTLSRIARAILDENRGVQVYGVALCKTERRSFNGERGIDLTNDHVPIRWCDLWEGG